MNWPNVIALMVLVIGVPLNVAVTLLLWRTYHQAPRNMVLRERFIAEVMVLALVVVFGFIFLNNDTLPPPLDTDVTKLVTRLMLLTIAVVPAVYWLYLYRKG